MSEQGIVLGDETIEQLCQQAVVQAAAEDLIGPSDMMDGRVGAIREALDDEGFDQVGIISDTAKYSSAYTGRSGSASIQLYGPRQQTDPEEQRHLSDGSCQCPGSDHRSSAR